MNVQCKLHLNCALRHMSVMSVLHGGKVPLQVELRSLTEEEVAHSRHSCTKSFSVFWPRVDWSERKLKIDEAGGGGACFVKCLLSLQFTRGLSSLYTPAEKLFVRKRLLRRLKRKRQRKTKRKKKIVH